MPANADIKLTLEGRLVNNNSNNNNQNEAAKKEEKKEDEQKEPSPRAEAKDGKSPRFACPSFSRDAVRVVG